MSDPLVTGGNCWTILVSGCPEEKAITILLPMASNSSREPILNESVFQMR